MSRVYLDSRGIDGARARTCTHVRYRLVSVARTPLCQRDDERGERVAQLDQLRRRQPTRCDALLQQTHLLGVGCALGGRPAERQGEMWHRQEWRRSGTAAPRVQCMRSVCAACTQHALS